MVTLLLAVLVQLVAGVGHVDPPVLSVTVNDTVKPAILCLTCQLDALSWTDTLWTVNNGRPSSFEDSVLVDYGARLPDRNNYSTFCIEAQDAIREWVVTCLDGDRKSNMVSLSPGVDSTPSSTQESAMSSSRPAAQETVIASTTPTEQAETRTSAGSDNLVKILGSILGSVFGGGCVLYITIRTMLCLIGALIVWCRKKRLKGTNEHPVPMTDKVDNDAVSEEENVVAPPDPDESSLAEPEPEGLHNVISKDTEEDEDGDGCKRIGRPKADLTRADTAGGVEPQETICASGDGASTGLDRVSDDEDIPVSASVVQTSGPTQYVVT